MWVATHCKALQRLSEVPQRNKIAFRPRHPPTLLCSTPETRCLLRVNSFLVSFSSKLMSLHSRSSAKHTKTNSKNCAPENDAVPISEACTATKEPPTSPDTISTPVSNHQASLKTF